ncbi:MAG: 23S rRNA (uracil(1939)-C(5))-methyltransferase RlmD [Limnohabitans sp.]
MINVIHTHTYDADLLIESMDLEAQGIAHRSDGKVVFVEGALPFERVTAHIHRKKNNWEQGTLHHLLQKSSQRITAECSSFGLHNGACGGCKMQHLNMFSQIAVKQRVLEDNLWHIGKVKPQLLLRPLQGPSWEYRHRARLSVRYVSKKSKVLIGFHERKSSFVADMTSCAVLPKRVSDMLIPLRDVIAKLSIRDQCPQIEIACGDVKIALTLRHLLPLSVHDQTLLRDFSDLYMVKWWLQPKGLDSVMPLVLEDHDSIENNLFYDLPEFGLRMYFRPTDFTQVNPSINRVLVTRAIGFLNIRPEDSMIDWFCGLGNFTLPMATLAHKVVGVEGSHSLLNWAQNNLRSNNANRASQGQNLLVDIDFRKQNLFEMSAEILKSYGLYSKWLIDPPREGAFALLKALTELLDKDNQWNAPKRIVYVSCNPATLARDAALLVNVAGYTCSAAGVVNMFPHTAHVESIAVFDR